MKTFVIDPHTKTIKAVNHDGSLENIHTLTQCDCFTAFRVDAKHCLFIDDEGLLKDIAKQAFFMMHGVALAGYAMLVGIDYEGETVAPSLTLEEVTELVHWVDKSQLRGL